VLKTIINFPKLHDGQLEIAEDNSRFRVLAAGRRWGKSRLGSAVCVAEALKGGRAWWVAPSYPVANVGWRMIKQLSLNIPGVEIRLVDRAVLFPGGGEAKVRSADNPDSLRGEGLDLVVLDECAFMKHEAWIEALRPSLSDRQGRAMFISTPKGRGWFWRLWQRGQDDQGYEWKSWQLPTSANPYIPAEEIQAARRSLPERVFLQEYEAQFLDDAGGVFRHVVDAAVMNEINTARESRQYVAGVDIATKVDFTVASVFDVESREMVYMDRFNRIDFDVLEDRLEALYRRFKLNSMTIEQNSIGQPVIEALVGRDLTIIPFTTTNATKQAAIQSLQAAFEHSTIKILNDPVLVGELQAFEGERMPSGAWKYSAPDGMHDDCVMSLAIAWHGLEGGTWDVY
jgi:phage terminase large subunit-like protein